MSKDYYVVFWDCIQALHFGLHDDCSHEIKRHLFLKRKPVTELDSTFKSRDITLPTKVRNNNVQMWELDHKEGWAPKNWCFWIVVLEKTLESSLDWKIKPLKPKRNQPWIFIGRTDAEAEASILWPPDVKSWLTWKDPDAGTDWRQTEKVAAEDEMVKEHHGLSGHEFEQTPGDTGVRGAWHAAVIEIAASQKQRSSWTATTG